MHPLLTRPQTLPVPVWACVGLLVVTLQDVVHEDGPDLHPQAIRVGGAARGAGSEWQRRSSSQGTRGWRAGRVSG